MTDQELHPPIDAELEATVWAAVKQAGPAAGFGLTAETVPVMREMYLISAGLTDEALVRNGTLEFEERFISDPAGLPDLPVLIVRPVDQSGPLPCIYVSSNGGKFLQITRGATPQMLDWAAELGAVIVSVAPNVGPEYPHPALIEGAYAGLVWTAEHAEELRIDPDRIMIFGGSGGGGLAAATALVARDRGGPRLTHQILVCPMLDDREITVSSKFDGINWDRTSNRSGWTAMLGDSVGGPDVSPYAAPARADDLSGLPPAYLDAGGSEVFRDEIIDYAKRLGEAGVPTELHIWAGGFHGFDGVGPDSEISKASLAARTSYVRRALYKP